MFEEKLCSYLRCIGSLTWYASDKKSFDTHEIRHILNLESPTFGVLRLRPVFVSTRSDLAARGPAARGVHIFSLIRFAHPGLPPNTRKSSARRGAPAEVRGLKGPFLHRFSIVFA
jgi:hypothetical protein